MSSAAAAPATTRYEAVIGIEIHVQLRTVSKMFCSCSTDVAGAPPNSRTCPVCLGLPGALPVINRRAVEHVLATGLAIGSTIPAATRWDRKNYFYPDLPKGYQISQYDLPLAGGGVLVADTSAGPVEVAIRRAHLEEDTARLIHQTDGSGQRVSLVDFNRSGMPLMEIVTEPVIRSAEAARRYAEELRLLLLTIGASDARMEGGEMRVEANVSLREHGAPEFGTRVEVKNMNSFRSVERAIGYEIERQARALDDGTPLVQETRGWDDDSGRTYTMRLKEYSEDYRYFPEPDLPPLRIDAGWLAEIKAHLPELPATRRARYVADFGLSPYDAAVLSAAAPAYFDAAMASQPRPDPKTAASLLTKVGLRAQKSDPDLLLSRPAGELAALVRLRTAGELSSQNAEEVYGRHLATGEPVAAIVLELGLTQITDTAALSEVVERVIAANPAAVADVRAGKPQAIKFLVGQVMRETRGQAKAESVQALLEQRLA
jgi:aspartyl-tRNA(Asn)/glutamyl-tRNA(Gln) amidotransferase subunit B